MTTTNTVTMADVIAAGLCATGCRPWFKSRGLDFRAFIEKGLPAETLAALNDPLADRAIAAMGRRMEVIQDGE